MIAWEAALRNWRSAASRVCALWAVISWWAEASPASQAVNTVHAESRSLWSEGR